MAARPVGRQLAGGPPEYQEGMPILRPVSKATTGGGGGSVSVRNILSGSGAGGVTLWGRDLGIVGGIGQYTGGGPRGFPQAGDGKEAGTTVEQDLE